MAWACGQSTGVAFLVVAIAAVALTLAALQVLSQQQTPAIKQANALGLSFLHFGWEWAAMPVLAVMGGCWAAAIATLFTRATGTDPPPSSASRRWSTLDSVFRPGSLIAPWSCCHC